MQDGRSTASLRNYTKNVLDILLSAKNEKGSSNQDGKQIFCTERSETYLEHLA